MASGSEPVRADFTAYSGGDSAHSAAPCPTGPTCHEYLPASRRRRFCSVIRSELSSPRSLPQAPFAPMIGINLWTLQLARLAQLALSGSLRRFCSVVRPELRVPVGSRAQYGCLLDPRAQYVNPKPKGKRGS
jgi:hypothetical protein